MKCTIWIVKLMRISNDDDDEMDEMTEWCGASARFLMGLVKENFWKGTYSWGRYCILFL